MKWAPHSPEDPDVEACRQEGINEDAIALLKGISWTTADIHFDEESAVVNYSDKQHLEWSRVFDEVFLLNRNEEPRVALWIPPVSIYDLGEGTHVSIDPRTGMSLCWNVNLPRNHMLSSGQVSSPLPCLEN
jgi:hypothetical protein